jgi:hypothetical protein
MIKDHDWISIRIINNSSGLYQGKVKIMPTKEYQCKRCGNKRTGLGVSKEDHRQMMNYAQLGIAQQAWDISQAPTRIKELEEKIRKLENK